jgi:PhzF family phenazine biosynthesis protein
MNSPHRPLRRFAQVDVFGSGPFSGNPLAVVLDGDGLSTSQMERVARWTNLSETTFVWPPEHPSADYRVRIFTSAVLSTAREGSPHELPFAGHPTLGTCHAWLEAGGQPRGEQVIQECGAGLVPVRRTAHGLAFAAPPLLRSGPVEPELLAPVAAALGLHRDEIVDAQWIDNGPGWVGLLLADAEAVLAVTTPSGLEQEVGLVGAYPPGSAEALEIRAFVPANGAAAEDPVTGSLNASVAGWLLESGRVSAPYVARQGTVLQRDGRIYIDRDDHGVIWVAGGTATAIRGEIEIS